MATTVDQSFLEFKKNLEITDLQATTVSTRQSAVRKVVQAGATVLEDFLTGSYARSTMIAPLKDADIDIFFVLDASYFTFFNGQNGGPVGLLDWIKRILLKTYTQTPGISRNGQAVTVRFSDFVVDVVPGFYRSGGGFLIPDSFNGSWIATDPKKHVELMSASNLAHNGDMVPLVKMIKAWNKENGDYFRSFHAEMMALHIFSGVTISNYPSGARFFFDKARAVVMQTLPDPAGYGGNVGDYLKTEQQKREAQAKLQAAYESALKAEEYASRYYSHSIDMWRKIFGKYFPSYG
jgi:hypothetical protein